MGNGNKGGEGVSLHCKPCGSVFDSQTSFFFYLCRPFFADFLILCAAVFSVTGHVSVYCFWKPLSDSISGFQNPFQPIGLEHENAVAFGKIRQISQRCHRREKKKFNYFECKVDKMWILKPQAAA